MSVTDYEEPVTALQHIKSESDKQSIEHCFVDIKTEPDQEQVDTMKYSE